MVDKTAKINCAFVGRIYIKFLKKRFGISSCSLVEDLNILRNQKELSDVQNYRDVSSPIAADSGYVLSCLTSDYLPVKILPPVDPTIAKIYYGASLTTGITQTIIESSSFITLSNTTNIPIDYTLLNQVNPMYYWIAVPQSIAVKTKWFVDINNQGTMLGIGDLFSPPGTVAIYHLYITNYKTAFDAVITFLP